ncbi:hypothetical protein R3P38DRAFT_2808796 [Favolaschia claudopus]|uniref:Uncharacterized protein n=1 Tax=Favolaschia claudopus TaxID=2862362 RepID=A0AAV9ZFY4_9AGAR
MDVKETVDQAIQQGNARVSNGNQADVGELAAHSCPLERKGNHGARESMEACTRVYKPMVNSTIHQEARNEAFDRDYKAICLAGKSEGIEALKQGTDLNIAFERKSVVLIECIWVFSMSCTQGQALQDPHILARIRDVGFRLLGIQRDIQKD